MNLSEDEIIKEIEEWQKYDTNYTNLPEYDSKNLHNAIQGLLDLYNKEKEKNIELQNYMKEYLIPKSTINLLYISKDKIKKLLDKYVGCYMKFYEKIQELLEEE